MILEFFVGIFIAFIAIITFLSLKYMESINKWILVTSKFVYYSGHPLLDEDQIFEEISKRFKNVFTSLAIVLLKTILFLVFILILLGLSSLFISILRGGNIPDINSREFVLFLFPKYLFQIPFLLGSLVPVLLAPILLKNSKKNKKVYSPVDKFLHYVFLGNRNIFKFLFKMELFFYKKQLKVLNQTQNIYISGLARAGTTVLMQYLGQLPEFKSVSYKNIPFLSMPKTGLKLISKKEKHETERFHQDGIKHSINSYEALEEPFWRNYIGEKYIKDKTLLKHRVDKNTFDKYNAFRKLIADDKIYLAKNNNHLLRADSLHELDRAKGNKTITIIPFRNPYEQAKSLLKQHLLLSKLQKQDEFTLDYMDFLVHHEFGMHTKISILNEEIVGTIDYKKTELEYWLEIWYLYFEEIYKQFSSKEGFYFICYESFVKYPKKTIEIILKTIGIPEKRIEYISFKEFKPNNNRVKVSKEDKYNSLYRKIEIIAINNIFNG